MKQRTVKGLALASVITGGLLLGSCDVLKDLEYQVKENPLEMHGGKVKLSMTAKFPEKGLHKKGIAEITPTFVCKDGTEIVFETKIYQGPKAAGNGEVIPKTGSTVTYNATVNYKPCMEEGELIVAITAKKGKKTLDPIKTDKIADGTIVTPLLMTPDSKVIMATDKFVRTTSESVNATINYEKGRHEVRPAELKDKDIKDFETFVTNAVTNVRREMKSVSINAYASPEGEIDINENLATDRAKTAGEYVNKLMNKVKYQKGTAESFITKSPKGEDWTGFKDEVNKTTHEDKELILRVLQMTSDPVQREKEIRNMAKTYQFLEKQVLPQLRRSNITLNFDKVGYSDEELKNIVKTNPDTLTVEEILYAATLVDDLNEKLAIYKKGEKKYPKDWRAINNVGYILFLQNDLDGAGAQFEKANAVEKTSAATNNAGAVAQMKGDVEKAKELFEAAGSSNETKYNQGLYLIPEGDYAGAIGAFGGFKTANVALAKILNKENDAALSTLEGAEDKDAALAYYLKAIIGARTNNSQLLFENLKTAIEKDASLKAKAKKDREFVKFFENTDFVAIVGA